MATGPPWTCPRCGRGFANRRIESVSPRNHVHHFRLASPDEADEEVAAWLAEAYQVGAQRHLRR